MNAGIELPTFATRAYAYAKTVEDDWTLFLLFISFYETVSLYTVADEIKYFALEA